MKWWEGCSHFIPPCYLMAHDTPEQVKHQASFVSTPECLLWHIISCSSLSTRLRLKWLPLNTAVSFASAGKTLGWCRRKLDRTISIKIWMYNYLPPHSVSVPMFRGCSSASQKTALISLSHQMGVKISVFRIFMYKINKHFVCALPKRGEGYVINLSCFLKLNCLCGFLVLKIPWFIHKSYYEMSYVKKILRLFSYSYKMNCHWTLCCGDNFTLGFPLIALKKGAILYFTTYKYTIVPV